MYVRVYVCIYSCMYISYITRVVGEVVITLLDSEDVELVYAACGVLLNLMAVQDLRSLLSDNGGVRKYVCVYYMCNHGIQLHHIIFVLPQTD